MGKVFDTGHIKLLQFHIFYFPFHISFKILAQQLFIIIIFSQAMYFLVLATDFHLSINNKKNPFTSYFFQLHTLKYYVNYRNLPLKFIINKVVTDAGKIINTE